MRILCYGDSNTWGHDPRNGYRIENRWTKKLQELMPEDDILEEGLCGRTLVHEDPYGCGRCGITALPMLIQTHQPLDLVVMMLGTNDLQSIYHVNAEKLAKGVRETIKVLRNPSLYEHYACPAILVVSPVQLRPEIMEIPTWKGNFHSDSYETSLHMAETIKAICEQYDCFFMDAADVAQASVVDGVHLDEENHQLLATAFYKIITDIKDRVSNKEV